MSGLISQRSEGIRTVNFCFLKEIVEKRCKIKLYIDKKNPHSHQKIQKREKLYTMTYTILNPEV